MTIDKIKQSVIDFSANMANDGAEPEDFLTAVDLLIKCTLTATPPHARTKVASIFFDTIRENL